MVVSDDGKYAIVYVDEKGDNNLVYFADIEKNGEITKKLSLTPIITEFENSYSVRDIFFTKIFEFIPFELDVLLI